MALLLLRSCVLDKPEGSRYQGVCLFTNGCYSGASVLSGGDFVRGFAQRCEMAAETKVDPLQLVPHRIKAFELIYEASRSADEQTTNNVLSRRVPSDKFSARHSDELKRTTRISEAELL